MTHGHVDFVHTRQIPLEQLDHAGYCLFTASDLLHRIDDALGINGKNRLNIKQRAQNRGRFADSATLLQIFQCVDQKIQLAGLAQLFYGFQNFCRRLAFRCHPCRRYYHESKPVGS
ncbi:hypothetical protein D3C81_1897610 [compost metagenome]